MSRLSHVTSFLITLNIIFLTGCGHKETIPDPMQTVSSFLRDLEFNGVAAASSYFVRTPRTSWKDFSRLKGNTADEFKTWQLVCDASELVEYYGLPAEYLSEYLIKEPKGAIITQDDFKITLEKFSFIDCQVSTSEYDKLSEGKVINIYGHANMIFHSDGNDISAGRMYIKIYCRYGNKGWKVTNFYSYDESMKGLF